MADMIIKNLTFTYRHGTPAVLPAVNVQFQNGHFILLTGPSGCGKSTLLKLIAGLYPNYAGTVEQGTIQFNEKGLAQLDASSRAKQVALLFQNPAQQFALPTVIEELIFALENQQVERTLIAQRCNAALKMVGIEKLRHRVINELSGGEQQKVALAIIIAMDSDVILLDEPFASVDPVARKELLTKLRQICNEQGKTIVLADHDLAGYDDLIDDLYVMDRQAQIKLLTGTEREHRFAQFEQVEQITKSLTVPTSDSAVFDLNAVSLDQHRRQLLKPTSLTIPRNATTLITGANGIGKSTFFDALVKLHPYSGHLLYQQKDLIHWRTKKYATQVGLLFQSATTQFLSVTVGEELALSQRHAQGSYFTTDVIQSALLQLDLAGREQQGLYDLSEGQQKKVQILSMLIMQPPVLLLDEPLRGLDLASVEALVQLLQQVRQATQQTMLIISHQLTGLAPLIDYQLVFAEQQLQYQEVLG